jgi:TatA/E family protein of Tat protein translocase
VIGDILQPTHLLFVLVIALLVLGPKRLPEAGKSLGKGLRELRQALSGEEHEHPNEVVASTPASPSPVASTPASPPPVASTPASPPPAASTPAEAVPEPAEPVREPAEPVREPAEHVG